MNKSKLIIILTSIVCIIIVAVIVYKMGDGVLYNRYKCPDTTYKLENRRCKKHEVLNTSDKLICKDGYDVVGNTCQKVTTVASKVFYSCDKGYTVENQSCVRTTTSNIVKKYKCWGGKLSKKDGTKCEVYSEPSVKTVGTEKVKYCKKGNLEGDNCIELINATESMGCPDGYTNVKNKYCEKKEVETPTINRSCEKGYNLEGIKCVKRETISGTYEASCNVGYTMKDGKCHKDIDIVATKAGLF